MRKVLLSSLFSVLTVSLVACQLEEQSACDEIDRDLAMQDYYAADSTATVFLFNHPNSPRVTQRLAAARAGEARKGAEEKEREQTLFEAENAERQKERAERYIPQIELGMAFEDVKIELHKGSPPLAVEASADSEFSSVTTLIQSGPDPGDSGLITITIDKPNGKVSNLEYSGFEWVGWRDGRPLPR